MLIRVFKWFLATLAVLVLSAVVALFYFNHHLTEYIEGQLNEHVKGYGFKVGEAKFLPTLALEVRRLTVFQTGHSDVPVAEIPRWKLAVQWRNIFSGVLVSDYLVERPVLHITLPHIQKEVDDFDKAPIHKKGWREAVYSFYPFKINELRVIDADITYTDKDPSRPLHLTHVNFTVGNIRNIRYPNNAYPSDFELHGTVFGSGQMGLEGHANFLSEPYIGINADLVLRQVMLEPFLPVTGRYNFQVRGGVLSTEGHLELTADGKTNANLKTLSIDNARIDFVHAPATRIKERRMGEATVENAKKLKNNSQARVRIDHAEIKNTEFGFVNQEAKTKYRVFLSEASLEMNNISNQFNEGPGYIKLTGKFMGSGETKIDGKFRPETKSPDFDLDAKIEKTQVKSMNNLLREYGNFDVIGGLFSVYAQLNVKDGRVSGYIKPLFKDMNVYDSRQDKEKSLFHKLYEGLVGGVAKLLENQPREEVATKTEVKGNLDDPKLSTWETVVNLMKNAFLKAILPGFEREVSKKKT